MTDLIPFDYSGQTRTVQVAYSPDAVREAVRQVDGESLIKGLESHLYVVELLGLGVKVGITESPSVRLGAHVRAARSHQRDVGRVWISCPHVRARENETLLIASCKAHLGTTDSKRREYFALGFDRAVEEAAGLLFQRGNREAFEKRVAGTADCLMAIVTNGLPKRGAS